MAEPASPLTIRTGAGRAVTRLVTAGLAGLSLFAALASTAPASVRLAVAAVLGTGIGLLIRADRKCSRFSLTVDINGRGELAMPGRSTVTVELDDRHWLSPSFAFVGLKLQGQARRLLVLPGRQAPGEYRRLLVWLRHRRMEELP